MSGILLESALKYAEMGFKVFPIHSPVHKSGTWTCSCGNEECRNPAKHPRTKNGLHDASDHPDQIEAWWKIWPSANIGIVTGNASGFFVLDVDSNDSIEDPKEGFATMRKLQPSNEADYTETVATITGSGGQHFWYSLPNGDPPIPIATGTNIFGPEFPDVDVRGEGGYIIAPPSVHISGRRYEFDAGSSFAEGQTINPAPTWLLQRLLAVKSSAPRRLKLGETSTPGLLMDKLGKGQRNDGLCRIGGYLRNSFPLDEAGTFEQLKIFNKSLCQPPLTDEEVWIIARSVAKMDSSYKAASKIRVEALDPDDVDFDTVDQETGERINHAMTDYGHACRVLDMAAGTVKHVPSLGGWLMYDGTHWTQRSTGDAPVARLVIDVSKKLKLRSKAFYNKAKEVSESQAEPINKKAAMFYKESLSLQSAARQAAVIRMVKNETAEDHTIFDTDALLINLANGTFDLETMVLRAHNPADYLTRMSKVSYSPDATCPTFMRFINEAMGQDEAMVDFMQRVAGYCLTGLTTAHQFYFFYGEGGNGKTTLIEIFRYILQPYCQSIPSAELMANINPSPIRHHIANLRGSRIAIASEVGTGCRLDEAKVKDLTGGDTVVADKKGQNAIEFKPSFKLMMYGNYKPSVKDSSDGIWRRLVEVPFEFKPEKKDDDLPKKLVAEASGILNWMIEGYIKFKKYGMFLPEKITEANARYRSEEDRFGSWIKEACWTDPTSTGKAKDLLDSCLKFFRDSNFPNAGVNATSLGRELARRGFNKARTEFGNRYMGIAPKNINATYDPTDTPADTGEYDPFSDVE